jgi:predicted RNA-binding Zn-ribbon protein involved in translation (DUF1610 family)
MDEGMSCISCGEWFSVIYNTGSTFAFCPMCGYEFTDEDFEKMSENNIDIF